eukprot:TRINITY_DN3708_c0_g1_i5.p1 TRINITY_DN3708_c0_g1~~TRINITY_DN3708_c0_g1_i5.p1  ORF type:complete len:1496 (+),score=271.92 TRINITY_DN3708_c0_g1_i5:81-4568(+)
MLVRCFAGLACLLQALGGQPDDPSNSWLQSDTCGDKNADVQLLQRGITKKIPGKLNTPAALEQVGWSAVVHERLPDNLWKKIHPLHDSCLAPLQDLMSLGGGQFRDASHQLLTATEIHLDADTTHATIMSSKWLTPAIGGCLLLIITCIAVYQRLEQQRGDAAKLYAAAKLEDPMETKEPKREEGEAGASTNPTEQLDDKETNFFELFRFMPPGSLALFTVGVIAQAVGASVVPVCTFFMTRSIDGIFIPNDDGTRSGTPGPHTQRDEYIHKTMYIYIVIGTTGFVCSFLGYYCMTSASMRTVTTIRKKVFMALVRQDVAWYEMHSPSELMDRFSADTMTLEQGLTQQMYELVSSVSMLVSACSLAMIRNWMLTLLFIGVMPLGMLVFDVAMKINTKAETRSRESYNTAGAFAQAALSSIRTVVAFNGQRRETDAYDRGLVVAEAELVTAGTATGLAFSAVILMMTAVISFCFFLSFLTQFGQFNDHCWVSNPPWGNCTTAGSVMSIVALTNVVTTIQIPSILQGLASSKIAAGRIYAVIDRQPSIGQGSHEKLEAPRGQVEFRNVSFAYPGRITQDVLRDVNLAVASGSTVAFVGPSGSGKSTIISLVLRFYDPKAGGSILFDGKDVRSFDLVWLRSQMALVDQEPVLFSGTVADNICYGSEEPQSRADIEKVAKEANAHVFLSDPAAFPQGYDTICGEHGTQLSGGQKQRIAIARALIRRPVLLLLDEATSALDMQSEKIVQDALDKLITQSKESKHEMTTMIVAQRLTTVKRADKIYVMDKGKVIQEGVHEELMGDSTGMYANMFELQAAVSMKEENNDSPVAVARSKSGESPLIGNTQGPTKQEETPGGSPDSGFPEEVAEVKDEVVEDAPLTKIWQLCYADLPLYIIGLAASLIHAIGMVGHHVLTGIIVVLLATPPVQFQENVWVETYKPVQMISTLNLCCLAMIIVAVFGSFAQLVQTYSLTKAGAALVRRLRMLVYGATLKHDMSWFDQPNHASGILCDELATQATQVQYVAGHRLAGYLQVAVSCVLALFVSLCFCWTFSLSVALFQPLALLPGAAVLWFIVAKKHDPAGVVSECLINFRVVSSYNLAERMIVKYTKLLELQSSEEFRTWILIGLSKALGALSASANSAYLVFMGRFLIGHCWMTPEAGVMALFPLLSIGSSIQAASQWIGDVGLATRAANSLLKTVSDSERTMLQASEVGGQEPASVVGRIEFVGVHFSYPQRPHASVMRDFTVVLQPNTTTALVGPSGGGKSTVIALLERYYDPTKGQVLFDGQDLRTLKLQWLRRQIGLVQQEPVLFAGSISDNIRYGQESGCLVNGVNVKLEDQACEKLVQAAAEAANAHNFIMGFAGGYNTNCGIRGKQLSGGQKQRIAIARTIFRNPAVLLLDEATSALDAESEQVVQAALEGLLAAKRRTTLVIAHRLSTIVNSEQICVVKDGHIVESHSGAPGEAHQRLKAIKGGEYANLLYAQHAKSNEVSHCAAGA